MADQKPSQGPAGRRFKDGATASSPRPASGSPRGSSSPHPRHSRRPGARPGVNPAYTRASRIPKKKRRARVVPVIVLALIIAVGAGAALFAAPKLFPQGEASSVASGQKVTLSIPQGSSGDAIASLLSKNHVVEKPADFYAAVSKLGAESSLKPGDYAFTTGQDPIEVVKQLVAGPNVDGVKLTLPEGITVDQVASLVEQTYGIPADDFKAQAKASNYAAGYSFLANAYNDSLEGYLYPKTYWFSGTPTADTIIRALLDQFKAEVAQAGLDLSSSDRGLTAAQVVTLASLVERETAVESERPVVASVIYNRLEAGMALQIDAAIVYARGGGSQAVSNADLQIDSPYNVYVNKGLTPGPICSPSVSSIKAALEPETTDYLYYVASPAGDGTHNFSASYDEFLQNKQKYEESLS